MAQVSMPSHSMTELYLIQGEVPETRDLDDARQWVTIYRELVTFADRTLNRLRREAGGNDKTEWSQASDADARWMEGHLRRVVLRVDVVGRAVRGVAPPGPATVGPAVGPAGARAAPPPPDAQPRFLRTPRAPCIIT